MESKMECADMAVVDCSEHSEPSAVSAEEKADELSKENARLKQKLECLQAILLGSAARQLPGPSSQVRARARRLSAPVQPPVASIPEGEPVYHRIRPLPSTADFQGSCPRIPASWHDLSTPPGTPPDMEEPSPVEGRPCRPSIVPTMDCSMASPPRPSTTPQVDCGQDEFLGTDSEHEEGDLDADLRGDGEEDGPIASDTPCTKAAPFQKRHRDEGVCGVPSCVVS